MLGLGDLNMVIHRESVPLNMKGKVIHYLAAEIKGVFHVFVDSSKRDLEKVASGIKSKSSRDMMTMGWISKGEGIRSITSQKTIHLSDPKKLLSNVY